LEKGKGFLRGFYLDGKFGLFLDLGGIWGFEWLK
jgi:hypothetical protein